MSQIQNAASKPGFLSLLPLFVCASAALTSGTYLYVWTHDLAAQDAQLYTSIGTTLSMPFGIVIALLWRLFYLPLSSAAKRFKYVLQPALERVGQSWIYHVAMLAFCTGVIVSATTWILTTAAVITWCLSLFGLLQVIRKRKKP